MTREMIVVRAVKLLLFASLCLALSPGGLAQLTTSGTLNGTVTDASGGVVPQAAITVSNEDTKVETHTASNGDGSFVVAGLPPGHYTVTIVKDQFQTFTETGIILNAAQVATVNPVLTVGQVATSVTVESSAVQVQTSTAEVSNQVTEQQVNTLPLNGRNYQSLSFLMPGVTNTAPDTAQHQGGFLTNNSISVNGLGQQGTMYYLDGIWNENTGNLLQTTVVPNPDTLQEVRLLQNNFGAQYSLNGASVMLLETKSGTQTFHGAAFEYLRNDAFDSANYFNNHVVSALKQNIFGYTLGGPFYIPHHYNSDKNKTFFFWSQQWSIQHNANVLRAAAATALQRAGTFGTTNIKDPSTGLPFPGNQIPANRISTGALALLNAIEPLPNNPAGGFLNYTNSNPVINNQRDDEIKVDHNFGSKLRLMVEYLDERQTNKNPYQPLSGSPFSTTGEDNITDNQLAQVRLTQLISPSMVNTTSISMNNYVLNLNPTGLVFQSQVPGFTEVLPFPITPRGGTAADRIPFIAFGGGYPIIGVTFVLPVVHAADLENTFSDDWSWLRGKHYLRAGVQYVRGTKRQTAFSSTAGTWVFTGQFTGNALADYLLGDAAQLSQVNNEFRGYQHYPIVSPYLEDQWKVNRKLSLTLGMRYAYSPNASWEASQAGRYSNFLPSLYNPAHAPIVNTNGTLTATLNYDPNNGIVRLGTAAAPRNYANKYKNYWNPTFGFAFDPFADGKTSIRGGYGITHVQTLVSSCSFGCLSNPPSIQTATLVGPNFPNSLGGAPAPTTPEVLGGENPGLREPIFQTYSLGVEHQFGEWFASVAGAGNIVNKLGIQANINQPVPEGGFDYNPLITSPNSGFRYASGIAGPAPFQGYGALNIFENLAYSNWNALEVNVKHPVGHNVFFSAAYTWQHGLSSIRGGNGLFAGGTFQDLYHPHNDYGTSNTNATHVLAISGIWNIPLFAGSKGWEGSLLGGWKFSDVTTIQSGFNLDPGLAIGQPGLSTRPNHVAGTNIAGQKTVAQWFNTSAFVAPTLGFFGNTGPGSIVGPGTINFDMALYKDFKIKERHSFQFRSEFFNIFNHTNFAGVQTAFGAGNFGQVISARDPRIIELVLRYQF
jgi:hypothetical protein